MDKIVRHQGRAIPSRPLSLSVAFDNARFTHRMRRRSSRSFFFSFLRIVCSPISAGVWLLSVWLTKCGCPAGSSLSLVHRHTHTSDNKLGGARSRPYSFYTYRLVLRLPFAPRSRGYMCFYALTIKSFYAWCRVAYCRARRDHRKAVPIFAQQSGARRS